MPGAVRAPINYILPTDEKPVTYLTNPGSKPAQRNAEYREVEVTIRDARPKAEALDLEREGFTFDTGGSAVSDFYDNDAVEALYSPEVERLVKQASGAAEVLVFDHTIRVADDTLRSERGVREPRARRPQRLYRPLGPAAGARHAAGRARRGAAAAPLRRGAGLAAHRGPGAGHAARDLRCPEHRRRGLRADRSGLHPPRRRGDAAQPQSRPPLVLLSRDGPRRGAGLQDLRFARRRPGALHCAHRLRRPPLRRRTRARARASNPAPLAFFAP